MVTSGEGSLSSRQIVRAKGQGKRSSCRRHRVRAGRRQQWSHCREVWAAQTSSEAGMEGCRTLGNNSLGGHQSLWFLLSRKNTIQMICGEQAILEMFVCPSVVIRIEIMLRLTMLWLIFRTAQGTV